MAPIEVRKLHWSFQSYDLLKLRKSYISNSVSPPYVYIRIRRNPRCNQFITYGILILTNAFISQRCVPGDLFFSELWVTVASLLTQPESVFLYLHVQSKPERKNVPSYRRWAERQWRAVRHSAQCLFRTPTRLGYNVFLVTHSPVEGSIRMCEDSMSFLQLALFPVDAFQFPRYFLVVVIVTIPRQKMIEGIFFLLK